jgi:hypothetical protein
MLSKLFHELIDVMHRRGLIDAGERDDLKARVDPAIDAATGTVAAEAAEQDSADVPARA